MITRYAVSGRLETERAAIAEAGWLPEPGILRTPAEHNRVEIPGHGRYTCVDAYATVATGGRVGRGDPVALN